MVGNGTYWPFEGREINDRSRKVTTVFAKIPVKTDQGYRWLVNVNRVSTIEPVEDKGLFLKLLNFFTSGSSYGTHDEEVIRYEVIK